ncbi:cell division inhibitor [Salmonella enterica subsp. diarizonae]|nr:cell division inhibitor [Salmonella enterica subsp. diarizonae]
MYTSGYANRSSSFSTTPHNTARAATENAAAGLVSEVVYHEDQPMMAQLLLLPLLRQLGQQSRWQLWLTPQQKLSREWVQSAGLPLTKVMQISQLAPRHTLGGNDSRSAYRKLQCSDWLAGGRTYGRRACQPG